jgi:hypothetical protein
MDIKYPHIFVRLVGEDGNAFSIIGRTVRAMRMEGISDDEISLFRSEATAGDYNHLLYTVMSWVNTCGKEEDDDDFFAELDAQLEEDI